MIGIIGIFVSLLLLIYLAYRGLSVLIVAPLMALVAVLFNPGTPILASYTQIFMPALGSFAVLYFPLFLLGAMFGKLMEDSGSARVIAEKIVARLDKQRSICKLSHRESYLDIFMVAVAGPLVALAFVVTLGSVFGSF